jgi:hypothetical protein
MVTVVGVVPIACEPLWTEFTWAACAAAGSMSASTTSQTSIRPAFSLDDRSAERPLRSRTAGRAGLRYTSLEDRLAETIARLKDHSAGAPFEARCLRQLEAFAVASSAAYLKGEARSSSAAVVLSRLSLNLNLSLLFLSTFALVLTSTCALGPYLAPQGACRRIAGSPIKIHVFRTSGSSVACFAWRTASPRVG